MGADAIPGEQWCEGDITHISFAGNRVTRAQVIARELVQQVGEACSLDDIIDGIQNIMDLGLFKSVRAELLQDGNFLELRYIVVEKYFFLAIPRISRTSDGELRFGVQLRWDNFNGRLHELKITNEKRQEDDGRGRAGFVHSLDYKVPRFFGSNYGFSIRAAGRRKQVELAQDDTVYGEAIVESEELGLQIARWLNQRDGIRGLRFFAGFRLEQRDYILKSGNRGTFRDGRDTSVLLGIENNEIHQEAYRRRGWNYGASLQMAAGATGSDFRYTRVDGWLAWYQPLRSRLNNLNVLARIGISDGAPFGERSYSIGGGEILRGVEPSRDTGNLMTLVNIEYLSAFFAYPTWRWVGFVDIGNVFQKDDVDLFNQNLRAGLGLRFKLEALTNTDLRIDLAWDPDQDKLLPYLATSLTF